MLFNVWDFKWRLERNSNLIIPLNHSFGSTKKAVGEPWHLSQVAAGPCKAIWSLSCWGLELQARSIDLPWIAWCSWGFHVTLILQLQGEIILSHCYSCGLTRVTLLAEVHMSQAVQGDSPRSRDCDRLKRTSLSPEHAGVLWPFCGLMFNISKPQYQKTAPTTSWKPLS